jgi:rRNA maturation endonuclease Nob1
MAIKDASNLPDDQVPDWVRKARERKRDVSNPNFRKGPTMSEYREDLRRFGPPPRVSIAERVALLATGGAARVEADAEDGTETLLKVTILSTDFEMDQVAGPANRLGYVVAKESSNGDVRWYRLKKIGEPKQGYCKNCGHPREDHAVDNNDYECDREGCPCSMYNE